MQPTPGAPGSLFSLLCGLPSFSTSTGQWEHAWVCCLLPHPPSLALPLQLFLASCPGPSCLALVPVGLQGPRPGCGRSWVVWPQGGHKGDQLPAALFLPESWPGPASFSVEGHKVLRYGLCCSRNTSCVIQSHCKQLETTYGLNLEY